MCEYCGDIITVPIDMGDRNMAYTKHLDTCEKNPRNNEIEDQL